MFLIKSKMLCSKLTFRLDFFSASLHFQYSTFDLKLLLPTIFLHNFIVKVDGWSNGRYFLKILIIFEEQKRLWINFLDLSKMLNESRFSALKNALFSNIKKAMFQSIYFMTFYIKETPWNEDFSKKIRHQKEMKEWKVINKYKRENFLDF